MMFDGHVLKRLQAEIAGVSSDHLAAIELQQRLADHLQQLCMEHSVIGRKIEGARLRRRALTAYKELRK